MCVLKWANEQIGFTSSHYLDLRGAVGDGHEQRDAEPQSLQQDDDKPLWPIKHHVLDGFPPVMLRDRAKTNKF